jgi:hypothetical protein
MVVTRILYLIHSYSVFLLAAMRRRSAVEAEVATLEAQIDALKVFVRHVVAQLQKAMGRLEQFGVPLEGIGITISPGIAIEGFDVDALGLAVHKLAQKTAAAADSDYVSYVNTIQGNMTDSQQVQMNEWQMASANQDNFGDDAYAIAETQAVGTAQSTGQFMAGDDSFEDAGEFFGVQQPDAPGLSGPFDPENDHALRRPLASTDVDRPQFTGFSAAFQQQSFALGPGNNYAHLPPMHVAQQPTINMGASLVSQSSASSALSGVSASNTYATVTRPFATAVNVVGGVIMTQPRGVPMSALDASNFAATGLGAQTMQKQWASSSQIGGDFAASGIQGTHRDQITHGF